MGVAILGGETTKPFYFNHNDSDEKIYKYKKYINPSRSWIDAWFPLYGERKTLCGKVTEYHLCDQDIIHNGTVTTDKDANLKILPNTYFKDMSINYRLKNWVEKDYFNTIYNMVKVTESSESKAKDITNEFVEVYRKKFYKETLECEFEPGLLPNNKPINSLFSYYKNGRISQMINTPQELCVYGPWMWDRIVNKTFIPDHLNNEIHPINQLWYKKNNETFLTGIVDATGYFDKKDATQVEASGLNQKMSFYKAFHISSDLLNKNITLHYQIEGEGFKFDDIQTTKITEDDYQLKTKNDVLIEVKEVYNRFKTHNVTFDQVCKRPDGSIQGYIVVETEKIRKRGGSINITLRSKPISTVSQLKSNGNDFTKMNLGAIGPFDDSQNWKSGDFNGDGKSDLLALIKNAQGSMRYTIYFSTDDSLRFDSKSDGLIINYNDGKWLVGDVNGDGKDDIINVYKNSANRAIVTTIFSEGNRFGDIANTQVLEKYYDSQIWATGDVNGDRKSDLVLVYGLSNGTTKVKVHLVSGSRYDSSNGNTINIDHVLSTNPTKVLVSDFNGDGKDDISLVYGGNGKTKAFIVYAGENSYIGQNVQRTELVGTGFENTQHWRAGDVNGDKKSDLIYVIPSTNGDALTGVHHSSGEAFLPKSLTTVIKGSRTLNRYIRGDFNGDGKADLINVMEYFPE